MGHTLVTRFTPDSIRLLHQLMAPFDTNKIPFGRNCDRRAANSVMDYHLTMFHWAKEQDKYYLDRIRNLKPMPCQISVTGMNLMSAKEGSWLLYFSVEPGQGFRNLSDAVEECVQNCCSSFLHITLAVSTDREELVTIKEHILQTVTFPFSLDVEGLDLYHIWRPTSKVQSL